MEIQKTSPPQIPPGMAFAIYFREDGGLLYTESLGSGSHGQVALVRPVNDGESNTPTLFARKRALGRTNRVVAGVDEIYTVREWHYPRHPHPSVPRALNLYFFGSGLYHPGFPGHAMRFPFLNGGNLSRLCHIFADNLCTFPEAFMWSVLTNITKVLLQLHEDGEVHRDVATRNIILNYVNQTAAYPDVFLGDFGLAGIATPSSMTADFEDLSTVMNSLAACCLGRYPPVYPLSAGEIWGPYSSILRQTITTMSEIIAYERESNILTNHIGHLVDEQYSRWKQDNSIKRGMPQGRLDWTRPAHPTTPLLFDTGEFATLIGGSHPRCKEIFGRGSMNPDRYVDHLGIAPPWEFAIVDRKTLSVVKVLTDNEAREIAKAWGTIEDVDADEVRKRSGWRNIPAISPPT